MLHRPSTININTASIFTICGKFNSILEERIQDGLADNHYIISIEVPKEEFDLSGNLTAAGELSFWREILRGLEKFDKGDIKLKPRKQQLMPPQKQSFVKSVVSHYNENRSKLPTPPQERRRLKPESTNKGHKRGTSSDRDYSETRP